MTSRPADLPDIHNEEEARRNECMHRVYSYLLQLAARKEAATRGEARNQTRAAARGIPVTETENHDRV